PSVSVACLCCLFSSLMIPPPLRSTLFPYTTLFRSALSVSAVLLPALLAGCGEDAKAEDLTEQELSWKDCPAPSEAQGGGPAPSPDRKSTRLNSSHVKISYAVFCLKKKTREKQQHSL